MVASEAQIESIVPGGRESGITYVRISPEKKSKIQGSAEKDSLSGDMNLCRWKEAQNRAPRRWFARREWAVTLRSASADCHRNFDV